LQLSLVDILPFCK